MNLSKLVGTIAVTLVAILCSFSTVNANTSSDIVSNKVPTFSAQLNMKVEGGPRDVVQLMTDVTIFQPETTNLQLNVVNSKGEVLLQMNSNKLKTVISTKGWDAGEYVIETIDDEDIYQEFVITVE